MVLCVDLCVCVCVRVVSHFLLHLSLSLSLQAHTGLIQMVAPPMTHFKRSARVRALVRVRACVCSCVCVRATAVLIWHPGFACCSVGRRVDSGSSKHKHPTGGPRRVWSRLVTLVSGQRTAPNSCLCQERAVNQPISQTSHICMFVLHPLVTQVHRCTLWRAGVQV